MWSIGFMIWRIGDVLDFDAQLDWVCDAGFEAVSFHASPGQSGQWRGVDPATTGREERGRLRERLSVFSMCEIHAPFHCMLGSNGPPDVLDQLRRVIEFARDVGALIVTVHGELGDDSGLWQKQLDSLDGMARTVGVTVGLELMRDFECLDAPRREHVGVTLDIGHMYFNEGEGYRSCGTIGGLVRSLGDALVHLHVHDYDGTYDHIEVGTGRVDFDDVLRGLADIGYDGALCLELNPDRVSPEGLRRSADFLRARIGDR